MTKKTCKCKCTRSSKRPIGTPIMDIIKQYPKMSDAELIRKLKEEEKTKKRERLSDAESARIHANIIQNRADLDRRAHARNQAIKKCQDDCSRLSNVDERVRCRNDCIFKNKLSDF